MMTTSEVAYMREAGNLLRHILNTIKEHIQPGTVLKDLEPLVQKLLKETKTRSGLRMQGFPADFSISLDNQVVQGLPDDRVITEDTLVSLDMTLFYCGFFVDKALSFTIDPSHYEKRYLVNAVKKCYDAGVAELNQGVLREGGLPAWRVGKTIEKQAHKLGVKSSGMLAGHGIGWEPHQPPVVPNTFNLRFKDNLAPGMCITVEPIVFYAKRSNLSFENHGFVSDCLSAHWEETLYISEQGVEVLT